MSVVWTPCSRRLAVELKRDSIYSMPKVKALLQKKKGFPLLADRQIVGHKTCADAPASNWLYLLPISVQIWVKIVLGSIARAARHNDVEVIIRSAQRLWINVILGCFGKRDLLQAVLAHAFADAID